jgi:NitT/TauT family transport system substrate-binding protein
MPKSDLYGAELMPKSISTRPHGLLLAVGLLAILVSGGCQGRDAETVTSADGRAKVRIGYLGLTCEAAMFAAKENRYFEDEGLDVEFVKTDWDSLRDGLGLGRFDANYHLVMYLLKPIEKGLDVKLTGGIHSGCLRLQAGAKSSIKSVAELKGKKIGVPTALGSPPFLFSSRVLKAAGMDPAKDVEWVAMAPDVLGLALDNGQIDAVCDAEPLGSILLSQDKVRTLADSAVDAPYDNEYCCAVVVSGKLARDRPEVAAKITRSLLKGALWVNTNPMAAAKLSVDKKYIAASLAVNSQAIAKLRFMPGVASCKESVFEASREMKEIKLLDPTTDPQALAKKAWMDLEGVDDAWVKGLKVESIAGGGQPPELKGAALAALFADARGLRVSCDDCCIEGPDGMLCMPE